MSALADLKWGGDCCGRTSDPCTTLDDAIVLDVREGAKQRAEELMQRLMVIEAERGDGA